MVFLTTAADLSHPLRMTINVFSTMTPYTIRSHSERSQESLEGKMGNGIVAQSEESIVPNDTLPAFSLRQQIFHVRFG